jgi:hypothetical protein
MQRRTGDLRVAQRFTFPEQSSSINTISHKK